MNEKKKKFYIFTLGPILKLRVKNKEDPKLEKEKEEEVQKIEELLVRNNYSYKLN